MKDKNLFIYLFLGIGLVLLILGIFYKKWNLYQKLKPRRTIAKFISEILGETGSRNYILFLSIIFLSFGSYLTYKIHIKPILPAEYSKKTTEIYLSKTDGMTLWTTVKKAEIYTDMNFDKVSLKNIFVDTLPGFIWEIKTLTTLDLENNNIEKISIEKLKRSNIQKIILTGNPISNKEVEEIKKLGIEVVKTQKSEVEK